MSDDAARILVVDDVPENVRLLEAVLEAHGYDVVSATDGQAALDLAVSAKPDLVLLDVMMPHARRLAVCRRLREREETAVLPVIMLTAERGVREDDGDRGRRGRLHPEAVQPATSCSRASGRCSGSSATTTRSRLRLQSCSS